jgi:hypothetical protein
MTAFATLLILALLPLLDGDAPPPAPVPVPAQPVQTPASPTVSCDELASPHGSDRWSGTRQRPFRSVPRLLRALRSGETGCLLPGRYRHHGPAELRRPRMRLVGIEGRVRVDGAIWIAERARGAQIRALDLTASDRTYFIPVKVQADRARVLDNRIRGSRSTTCVLIGSTRRTVGVRIEGNWIHDCGRRGKLDHLIYVQNARRTVIRGNVLNANRGGWGVHLYPNADGSIVERNLIDGNQGGVIFGGDRFQTSDRNLVRWNAITFSSPRWNVESSWGGPVGSGNVARANCLYSTGRDAPTGLGWPSGFTIQPNVSEDSSPYSARDRHDFRFPAGSRCAKLVEPLPTTFRER